MIVEVMSVLVYEQNPVKYGLLADFFYGVCTTKSFKFAGNKVSVRRSARIIMASCFSVSHLKGQCDDC